MMEYGAAPAVGYWSAPATEQTVVGPAPSAPPPSFERSRPARPSWAPDCVSSPIIVDLPPYVAANSASPSMYHWASPAFAPAGALPRGIDSAAITSVAMVGDLVLDHAGDKQQSLLTAGPPAWTLPAIAGSSFLAIMGYAFASEAVVVVRAAVAIALAAIGG